MMGAHGSKGEPLLFAATRLNPCICFEYPVVGMIIHDDHASVQCKSFEGNLAFEGLVC